MQLCLPQDVLLYDGLEAGHVPEVEECEADDTGGEQSVGLRHEQLVADRVEPGHYDHPEEEGEDVDVGVDPVAGGELVNLANQMEDPGLVEDGVDLRHQNPQTEAHTDLCLKDSEVTCDGRNVMNGEERVLLVENHLHRLHSVYPEAEEEAEAAGPWGGVEEVVPDVLRVVESPDRPETGDAGVNTSQECRPPLVVSHPAGGAGWGRREEEEEEAAQELYQGTQQEDGQASQVQAGQLLAESLQLREIFWVSEVHSSDLSSQWSPDLIWLPTSQSSAYILISVILKNVRKLGNPDSGIKKSDNV